MVVSDEAVEAAARVLDPEIWVFLPSTATRSSAVGLHARRETSLHYARAALTAALPFMGVGEQGSPRDTGKHPCGEQPSPAVSATAALVNGVFGDGFLWRCGCCTTEFRSPQEVRPEGNHSGPKCPYCKAFGQFTYRATSHLGDPCVYCGTPHDEVAIGPCPGLAVPGATASPTTETGTEKVAAQVERESSRDEPIPTTPATVGGESTEYFAVREAVKLAETKLGTLRAAPTPDTVKESGQ